MAWNITGMQFTNLKLLLSDELKKGENTEFLEIALKRSFLYMLIVCSYDIYSFHLDIFHKYYIIYIIICTFYFTFVQHVGSFFSLL